MCFSEGVEESESESSASETESFESEPEVVVPVSRGRRRGNRGFRRNWQRGKFWLLEREWLPAQHTSSAWFM